MAGLLTQSQLEGWSCVARIEEFIQNHSRSGWTEADADTFHRVALRYTVLMEERFSGLDNYACWVKERAVKRYIRQSNNHKNIEVTFPATDNNRDRRIDKKKVDLQKVFHCLLLSGS